MRYAAKKPRGTTPRSGSQRSVKQRNVAPKKSRASSVITVLVSIALLASACLLGGRVPTYLSGVVAVAAGLALPEGGRSVIVDLLSTTNLTPTAADKSTTEKTTKAVNTATPEAPKNLANKSYLTKTPDDVLKLMKQAAADAKGKETGGTTKKMTYTLSDGTQSYDKISVRNTTEQIINIERLMTNGISLTTTKDEPSVLIYHSHTTETFCLTSSGTFPKGYSGRSTNAAQNMVRIGNELVTQLEQAGIRVLHDTTIYDKTYDDAYDLSRKAVEKHLKEHPSIQITLDVHRDAIHYDSSTYARPVTDIFGKQSAQVMLLTGAEGGRVESFPNWQQNLDFALTLQHYGENLYPGLMRPIMFCQRKYNLDLGKYSLLLEMGADGNTLEEAVYAARLLGNALAAVILDYTK